ncbi:MAG: Lrp/AsnC family transcriptional regulator [Pseudomonadota bacterium]
MYTLDDTDRRLLRLWQTAPDLSVADLASQADLPPASCWRRIEKLEAAGIIRARTIRVDPRALGYAVDVSLRVTLDKTARDAFDTFLAAARDIPEVNEIQTFLGRVDVRLNVIARDMTHYQQIYRTQILSLPHIADIEALMHVADVKIARTLPL